MAEKRTAPSDSVSVATLDSAQTATRQRVLTGMRPTGPLHLGHFVGALEEWKRIQDEGQYESFFLVADIQALTTHADHPELLRESIKEVVLDWLSVGLDPNLDRTHFVLQSDIPERAELSILLDMVTPYAELMRNPTLKSELDSQKNATVGFMRYPVDQVADICMVSPDNPRRGDHLLVPVGEDQVPHLEFARSVARRVNKKYGKDGPILLPCEPLVGRVGRLVGVDGTDKMSKSKGNAIYLSDDPKTVEKKVMRMFTDPNRKTATDPGETENNPVFIYLRAFDTNKDEVAELEERYREGRVGDVEVKKILARVLNEFLEPIREKRAQFKAADIKDMLHEGKNATREVAQPVVDKLRRSMYLGFPE